MGGHLKETPHTRTTHKFERGGMMTNAARRKKEARSPGKNSPDLRKEERARSKATRNAGGGSSNSPERRGEQSRRA